MSKISPYMLVSICENPEVRKMFLDFENHTDYFVDGSKEDYLQALKERLEQVDFRMLFDSGFFNPAASIQNINAYELFVLSDGIENHIGKDFFFKNVSEFKEYLEMKLFKETRVPDQESGISREDYRESVKRVLDRIDEFYKTTNYEKLFYEQLGKFESYTDVSASMDDALFEEFASLIETAGIDIPMDYVNTFFRELIRKERNGHLGAIINCTRSMVHNLAKEKGTPCFFRAESDLYASGTYSNNEITISYESLKKFSRNPILSAKGFFETIFHEFKHLVQDMDYKSTKAFTYNEIKMLKDLLLFESLNSKFRDENYESLSYELDARQMSRVYAKRYLESIGASFYRLPKSEAARDEFFNGTNLRVMGQKTVPVDHLFDELISDVISTMKSDFAVDIFEKYPVMSLMYTKEGRRITSLELFKRKAEASKELETAKGKKKKELEDKIFTIEEILENQDLSYVNLVADFKEMVDDIDFAVDQDEKTAYMTKLYDKARSSNSKKVFKHLVFHVGNITQRGRRSVLEQIASTLNTGAEMLEYFNKKYLETIGITPETPENPNIKKL